MVCSTDIIARIDAASCRTRWTVSVNTSSMVETEGGGGDFEVVDVSEISRAADCVAECDRHHSCRAVDVNETSTTTSTISCRFYLGPADDVDEDLGSVPAPGVAQFVAERCPEDGNYKRA